MQSCSNLFVLLYFICSGYSEAKSSTESVKEVKMDKEVTCNVGTVRYFWDTALNEEYSVSRDFYYAVKNLPAVYNDDTRLQHLLLIENYGTVSA